jgi:hypothetical protein
MCIAARSTIRGADFNPVATGRPVNAVTHIIIVDDLINQFVAEPS